MKRLIFAIVLMVGFVACIDESYDLSKIKGDDIAIGNEESEFEMPLANVTLRASQFVTESDKVDSDVVAIYEEADIWLPTQLPTNTDYINVVKMEEDITYLENILDALFVEMEQSVTKRKAVCNLIATSHRNDFVEALGSSLPEPVMAQIREVSDDEAAALIEQLFLDHTIQDNISHSIAEVAKGRLTEMQMKDVVYEIGDLGLGDEVEQMIIDNLDPKGVEPVVNALYLSGTIDCEFPFTILVEPRVDGTNINLGELYVSNEVVKIEEVRLYADDMLALCEGATMTLPIRILRYYPHHGFGDKCEVHIHLQLRKTGNLQL